MKARGVARTLSVVLLFQLAIGGLLVLGDIQSAPLTLPRFAPGAPKLSEPVRPGDQRRRFAPGERPAQVSPLRDPGQLPERLTLSFSAGDWRLEGAIAAGDADRLIPQIERADPPVVSLILQSPGGSVTDALTLGRYLRRVSISTRMLSGEFCLSACPYLLAGGVARDIAEGASVGVHQHYFGENTLLPAFIAVEDIQRGQGEVMAYLHDMGIDPLVMQHALTTPADEIYILVPEELARYGFTPSHAPANLP